MTTVNGGLEIIVWRGDAKPYKLPVKSPDDMHALKRVMNIIELEGIDPASHIITKVQCVGTINRDIRWTLTFGPQSS